MGIKTIVIDHHQIHKKINKKNIVIINPLKNHNSSKFTIFCATTIVYFFIKYANSLLKRNIKINEKKYLFFVTLATICDQMPLRNLNRSIVKQSLNIFNINEHSNLKKI